MWRRGLCVWLLAGAAFAEPVEISWTPPTENVDGSPLTDLASYNVYRCQTSSCAPLSRAYTHSEAITDPAATSATLDWPPGQYHVAMTALDADGNESAYSNEVVKTASSSTGAPGNASGTYVWDVVSDAPTMTFPTIAATPTASGRATAGTTQTIDYPSTIAAGEQLLAFIVNDGNVTLGQSDNSDWTNEGWTILADDVVSGGAITVDIAYMADPTGKAGGSFAVTSSASEAFQAIVVRIAAKDFDTTAPQIAIATGTSSTPDPPASPTPGNGAQDYLFIGFAAWDNGNRTLSAYPSDLPDNQNAWNQGGSGGVALSIASDELNRSTAFDPASWDISSPEQWVTATLIIHPDGGGNTVNATPAATGSSALATVVSRFKGLTLSGAGASTLARLASRFRALTFSGAGTASLTTDTGNTVTATPSGTGTSALARLASRFRALTFSGTGTASLTTDTGNTVTATPSGTGTSVLATIAGRFRSLVYSALGSPTLARITGRSQSLISSGTGAAGLTTDTGISQAANMTGVGTAGLTTEQGVGFSGVYGGQGTAALSIQLTAARSFAPGAQGTPALARQLTAARSFSMAGLGSLALSAVKFVPTTVIPPGRSIVLRARERALVMIARARSIILRR